jgi:hypothetical protein
MIINTIRRLKKNLIEKILDISQPGMDVFWFGNCQHL